LKLDRVEAATAVRDLAALPGNCFEALEWLDGELGPSKVEIIDYH
jgi:plasmid maintenance system killer protein